MLSKLISNLRGIIAIETVLILMTLVVIEFTDGVIENLLLFFLISIFFSIIFFWLETRMNHSAIQSSNIAETMDSYHSAIQEKFELLSQDLKKYENQLDNKIEESYRSIESKMMADFEEIERLFNEQNHSIQELVHLIKESSKKNESLFMSKTKEILDGLRNNKSSFEKDINNILSDISSKMIRLFNDSNTVIDESTNKISNNFGQQVKEIELLIEQKSDLILHKAVENREANETILNSFRVSVFEGNERIENANKSHYDYLKGILIRMNTENEQSSILMLSKILSLQARIDDIKNINYYMQLLSKKRENQVIDIKPKKQNRKEETVDSKNKSKLIEYFENHEKVRAKLYIDNRIRHVQEFNKGKVATSKSYDKYENVIIEELFHENGVVKLRKEFLPNDEVEVTEYNEKGEKVS